VWEQTFEETDGWVQIDFPATISGPFVLKASYTVPFPGMQIDTCHVHISSLEVAFHEEELTHWDGTSYVSYPLSNYQHVMLATDSAGRFVLVDPDTESSSQPDVIDFTGLGTAPVNTMEVLVSNMTVTLTLYN
jgi:hypothetical protein